MGQCDSVWGRGWEEGVKVLCGLGGYGFEGSATEFGQERSGVGDEGGFILLSAMRDGGEEGAVGLYEDAIGGGGDGGGSDSLRAGGR